MDMLRKDRADSVSWDKNTLANTSAPRRTLLKNAFPNLYVSDIDDALNAHTGLLYPAFLVLDRESRQGPADRQLRSKAANRIGKFINIHEGSPYESEQLAGAELKAARAWVLILQEDARNLKEARAKGAVADCGCCFDEFARNAMVHCNGEKAHWFCVTCARQNAATALGDALYKFGCMSTDGCKAGFSRDQKDRFLDEGLEKGLDEIEQETILRLANMDDLVKCPFCTFAAVCPPVDEDRIFECQSEACLKVSCRLCSKEAHIPKTCEEAARENNDHVRHQIEEAMSEAVIRRCNKCKTLFPACLTLFGRNRLTTCQADLPLSRKKAATR